MGLLLSGCASQQNLDQLAEEHQLVKQNITTHQFSHLLITTNTESASHEVLQIYIEGDGTPWLRKDAISSDPTPQNPLALKLMLQDPTPSIYLGRPCYFGLMDSTDCVPPIWTHRRYSEEVINSMQAALEKYLQANSYRQLTFIGYSGGGVVAMLLAERFSQTNRLITIAANLDIDAWTQHHNFSALTGSINPAKQPPLPQSIQQTHFAGKRDTNVPLAIIKYVSSRQTNSRVRVFEKFDHICCWEKEWPQLLKLI
ncbi:alpha/beta fold hydrolase [Kaarinaea lacus]